MNKNDPILQIGKNVLEIAGLKIDDFLKNHPGGQASK